VPASQSLPARSAKIFGLVAVADLVTGLVLAFLGLSKDNQVLSVVGVVLLLSGGGMLAFVTWNRNKPEAL
jgi:hypothetical protein